MVAVADVLRAVTAERPYRTAWPLEDAVDYVKAGSGNHFDPKVVEAFLDCWEDVLAIRAKYQDAS